MEEQKVVLAIDDDPQQLGSFRVFLESRYDLRTTKSASEAMFFLSKNEVDLILLDIEMPNVDGFELLKDIRNYPSKRHLPVIIISGNKAEDFLKKAKESSAADILSKPVRQDTLITTIEKALANAEKPSDTIY